MCEGRRGPTARVSLSAWACAVAIVFVQQGGDIEALALCDLDEIEEGAEFLGLHVGEPVKIILTETREQSQLGVAQFVDIGDFCELFL